MYLDTIIPKASKTEKAILYFFGFGFLFSVSAIISAICYLPYLRPKTEIVIVHPLVDFVNGLMILLFITPVSTIIAFIFYWLKINRYAMRSIIEPLILGPVITFVSCYLKFSYFGASHPIFSYLDDILEQTYLISGIVLLILILAVQGIIIHLTRHKPLASPSDT